MIVHERCVMESSKNSVQARPDIAGKSRSDQAVNLRKFSARKVGVRREIQFRPGRDSSEIQCRPGSESVGNPVQFRPEMAGKVSAAGLPSLQKQHSADGRSKKVDFGYRKL